MWTWRAGDYVIYIWVLIIQQWKIWIDVYGNLKEQIKDYEKLSLNMNKQKHLIETSYPCDLYYPLLISRGWIKKREYLSVLEKFSEIEIDLTQFLQYQNIIFSNM